MTPERFWNLVSTLNGVADDNSCAALDVALQASGEGAEFAALLEQHVDALVNGCRWPSWIAGSDSMNWVASAVVASGRSAYKVVLDRTVINPEEWDWVEAEALLVVGADRGDDDEPPADDGQAAHPVLITLQWLARPSPGRAPDDGQDDGEDLIDMGDDPAWGRVPVYDLDWVAAQQVLATDESFLARREHLGALGLTVRPDVPEGQPAPPPESHSPFDGIRPVAGPAVFRFEGDEGDTVVLVVPSSDFPSNGSRVESYVRAARRLVEAAEDA